MAIGTIDDLINAAEGRRSRLSAPLANQMEPALRTAAAEQAMSRYMGETPTNMPTSPVRGQQPTSMYSSIMGGLGIGSTPDYGQGLSKKGKYGGFYTASDLESAIGGRAVDTRSMLSSSLRGLAESRYQQLNPMYKQYGLGVALPGGQTGALAQMVGKTGKPGFVSQGFVLTDKKREAAMSQPGMSEYQAALGKWYQQNIAPAEEALSTAQQIEATPYSQIARSLATSQYGMNPALAASKFADLDTREYERARDAQYLANYGVPYQQYKDIQEESTAITEDYLRGQERAAKAGEEALDQSIQQRTGYSTSTLKTATGRPAEWIDATLNTSVDLPGEKGATIKATGDQALLKGINYLREGNVEQALNLAALVEEQNPDLAELINAILASNVKYRAKAQDQLLFAPSIYGQ